MKTKMVKDVPIGVLLIVFASYFVYGVFYLTNLTSVLTVLTVILFSVLSWNLMLVGIDLLFGMEVKDKE